MKKDLRNILKEEGVKNQSDNHYLKKKDTALKFLNSFNLELWEDRIYKTPYLATPNGVVLLMIDYDELVIQYQIYDMLLNILKTDSNLTKFLRRFIKNYGLKTNFSHIVKSENIGNIDEDDDNQLTVEVIQESTQNNPLKSYFFKLWDKQKKEGKVPTIGNLQRLGLLNKRDIIITYFVEYMGYGDVNSRSKTVEFYLTNLTFDESDITLMEDYFDQGKIDVKFTNVDFRETEGVGNYLDLTVEFTVLSGSFYNSEDGEIYNFSSGYNPFDDFTTYIEFKDVIENIVTEFVHNVLESFGYRITQDFDLIDIKWV